MLHVPIALVSLNQPFEVVYRKEVDQLTEDVFPCVHYLNLRLRLHNVSLSKVKHFKSREWIFGYKSLYFKHIQRILTILSGH